MLGCSSNGGARDHADGRRQAADCNARAGCNAVSNATSNAASPDRVGRHFQVDSLRGNLAVQDFPHGQVEKLGVGEERTRGGVACLSEHGARVPRFPSAAPLSPKARGVRTLRSS